MPETVQKEQEIITEVDEETDKFHRELEDTLIEVGHPAKTRPPQETHPLSGLIDYGKTTVQEAVTGAGGESRVRVGRSRIPLSISGIREWLKRRKAA